MVMLIVSSTLLKAQGPGGLVDGGGVGDSSTTTPVKKITLTADRNNDVVKLSWATIGESQMLSFTVEKSVTGNTFTALSTVVAKNTQVASYSSSDVSNVTTDYRIKATDAKGIVNYSNVKLVSENSNVKISAYPNPLVSNTLHITSSNLAESKYRVTIFNNTGKNVFSNEIDGTSNLHDLKVGFLPTGLYYFTVSSGSKVVYNSALQIK